MRKVNLIGFELDEEGWARGTIASRGESLAPHLGAVKIGAGLYEADAGRWIWPYHYHHGVEEWLYVIGGAPVLRDPHGERTLASGDFVCFPSGQVGAHTVAGPGRFVMFSAGGWPAETGLAVYPDSDKIGARPADHGVDNLNFRRQDAVGYWYGEGSEEPVGAAEIGRSPLLKGRQAVLNVDDVDLVAFPSAQTPEGFRGRVGRLGPLLGSERLGAALFELDPGEGSAPYHFEHTREEWLLVLAGVPSLRHPDGEDQLSEGDVVCFPAGPAGAHRIRNRGTEVVRGIFFSSMDFPYVTEYPDSGKLLVKYSRELPAAMFRLSETVSYWD